MNGTANAGAAPARPNHRGACAAVSAMVAGPIRRHANARQPAAHEPFQSGDKNVATQPPHLPGRVIISASARLGLAAETRFP